ncbi:MAG TPA: SOS response-associated peptidase [Eubacteriales bacterium]|nr:SOS response-associated peptidase [Eubacteriales bacterium]
MCGRYYIAEDDEDSVLASYIAQALARAGQLDVEMRCGGEIRPTDIAPVIATSAAHRTVGAFPMRWGFRHPTRGMLVFNTRSETAAEKPLFCTSIIERRCLIPASGYYEWQKSGAQKVKFSFSSGKNEPLYLAGLYFRSSRDKLPFFTILTRDATDELKFIHSRMPVLLSKERMHGWLSPEEDYRALLAGAAADLRYEAC